VDLPFANVPCLSTPGHAYALSGRLSEALPLLEQCVAPATFAQSARHSFPFINLGEGYLLAGQVNDALEVGTRGFEYARGRKDRGMQAWALRLLGEIASHGDPLNPPRAQTCYREASTLAGELAMRPVVAHCHLGLGKLYRRAGEREQAREHLTAATTMYREMDMRFWLEKAEAEMTELA
jgi:tetratricopeptide (TPR) repeat protein